MISRVSSYRDIALLGKLMSQRFTTNLKQQAAKAMFFGGGKNPNRKNAALGCMSKAVEGLQLVGPGF